MILNRIIGAIYVPNAYIIEQYYKFFTSVAAILNISNFSRVATCHPTGIVHWNPIDELSKEKKTLSFNFTLTPTTPDYSESRPRLGESGVLGSDVLG